MSFGKIYSVPGHPRTIRSFAAAKYAGLPIDFQSVELGKDNRTSGYLEKFPTGKIPAFEGQDGFRLIEASAIAQYIASHSKNYNLLGTNAKEAAKIQQWVSFVDHEILPHQGVCFRQVVIQKEPYNRVQVQSAVENFGKSIQIVEKHLLGCTFLVEDRITLADLTLAGVLLGSFNRYFDDEFRKSCPNVMRHFDTVINQPILAGVYEPRNFVKVTPKYIPPKKEKEEQPKPAEKAPKEPKPKDADEEEGEQDKSKSEGPLDNLPDGNFNLPAWKLIYTRAWKGSEGSLPNATEAFHSRFKQQKPEDPVPSDFWSLWKLEYNFGTDESAKYTLTFQYSNLITTHFNDLEKVRNLKGRFFCVLNVLGEGKKSIIKGVALVCGKNPKPADGETYGVDWGYYKWSPLDLSNAEDKKYFDDMLNFNHVEGDKACADGQIF